MDWARLAAASVSRSHAECTIFADAFTLSALTGHMTAAACTLGHAGWRIALGGAPLQRLEIDIAYLTRLLARLLRTPSPTGFTDAVVGLVCEELAALGLRAELTRRGAIRANLSGQQKSPDRAIVAHVDTLGAMVKKPQG